MESKFRVPKSEIDRRIQKAQRLLQENDVDGLFVVQRADLFYFSGTAQKAFLFIPARGEPLLMVKRYPPRARDESPIPNIGEISSIKEVPGKLAEFYGGLPSELGFELDVLPVKEFDFYRRLFKKQTCLDGSSLIHEVRRIKSPWEIDQMHKAAELSERTFDFIRENIRPGYTEMEFAGMYEAFARKFGQGGKLRVRDYQAEGYPWHLLSGKSGGMVGVLDSPASGEGTSPAFPCGAGPKILKKNEPIMIDLGSVLNGYHFDETRMFAIESMPKKALDSARASIEIHDRVLDKVKPGVTLNELFRLSVDKAKSLGYEEAYLGVPGYKVNFIGHGIGVELVEDPIISERNELPLEPGMIFALEPKMIFEKEFTAGIESVFLVTETGHQMISRVPAGIFIC